MQWSAHVMRKPVCVGVHVPGPVHVPVLSYPRSTVSCLSLHNVFLFMPVHYNVTTCTWSAMVDGQTRSLTCVQPLLFSRVLAATANVLTSCSGRSNVLVGLVRLAATLLLPAIICAATTLPFTFVVTLGAGWFQSSGKGHCASSKGTPL
jgi:hypothetical protein